MWKMVTFSLHCFSLLFCPSLFSEIIIKCVKRTLSCWRLSSLGIYEDADHTSCQDTRRSVSGGAVMLCRGAISWFSQAQRITATATSESEYVALVEIVNELRFVRQVKAFMVPPIDYTSVFTRTTRALSR